MGIPGQLLRYYLRERAFSALDLCCELEELGGEATAEPNVVQPWLQSGSKGDCKEDYDKPFLFWRLKYFDSNPPPPISTPSLALCRRLHTCVE